MHGARPLRSTRRLQNLMPSLPKWYNIAPATDGPTLISIFDEIGFYGVSAGDFLADLKGVTGDLEVHISSPGGDIYDGLTIYNQLRQAQARGNVRVIVDGLAASAASFIAMAASPGMLEMAPHSELMIHDGFCLAIGNAADMRELAGQLDRASDNIAGIYADRTGKPADYWREKMRAETWYSDTEAVAEGLADKIHGQEHAPAQDWDMSVFARYADREGALVNSATVAGVQRSPESAAEAPQAHARTLPCPSCQSADSGPQARFCAACGTRMATVDDSGWVQDPDGSWRFDPDGDGDDDSTPEGDTDHDYFAPDGTQKKPIPPKPGAAADVMRTSLLNADMDNSAWDAAQAWHNGATSDDPAAFYKGICAGRKSGPADQQSSWALPYKYHPGDAPNAAGVRAALARIGSVQGLTNKDEAQATLERLMKQVNPDYSPDDLTDMGLLSAALLAGLGRG